MVQTEILSFATAQIELEDIMLSEMSQMQKDKHYVFLLMEFFFKVGSQVVVTKGFRELGEQDGWGKVDQ